MVTHRHYNLIHFEHEAWPVVVWAHRVFLEQVDGIYTPRLGGWAW